MKIGDIFGAGEVSKLIGDAVNRVFPDKSKLAELDFEKVKLELTTELAQQTNNLELEKLNIDNIKSAREREAQVVTSEHTPYITKITTTILAWGVVGLTFALYGFLLFSQAPITPEKKDIIIYILGALTAISGQIISYYFGSTIGSSKRTDSLMNMVKNK